MLDFAEITNDVQRTVNRRAPDIDSFYLFWVNSQENRLTHSSNLTLQKQSISLPVFTDVSHSSTYVVWGEAYKKSEPLFAKLRLQARDELTLRIARHILSYLVDKYEKSRNISLKQDPRLTDSTIIANLVKNFSKYLKNETTLFVDTTWEELCDWFGEHLKNWILEEMERKIGSEEIDKLNKEELNSQFYQFLSNNLDGNEKFVLDFAEIINQYTKKWIEKIIQLLQIDSFSVEKMEEILEIKINDAALSPRKDIMSTIIEQGNILVMSNAPYQTVREAISNGHFKNSDDLPWPVAELRKGTIEGMVLLKPVGTGNHLEKALKQQHQLSELTVDVYDALCSFFLSKARHHKNVVEIQLDDLLLIRGVKPKLSGSGRRGGYESGQRQQVLKALSIIQSLWIDLNKAVIYEKGKAVQMQLKGRAFVFKDYMDKDIGELDPTVEKKIVFSVDEVFAKYLYGSGRQVAFLPIEALKYNPYRENWEKKLLRYLSWRWRTQARKGDFLQPHKIGTLLEMIGKIVNERTPSRTRDRLEQALDMLLEDGVIAAWHYEKWDESVAATKGWGRIWANSTILIEPPIVIIDQYKSIERSTKTVAKNMQTTPFSELAEGKSPHLVGQQVRDMRKSLHLSLYDTAEELEISPSYLSNIERELKVPSNKVRNQIIRWLNMHGQS